MTKAILLRVRDRGLELKKYHNEMARSAAHDYILATTEERRRQFLEQFFKAKGREESYEDVSGHIDSLMREASVKHKPIRKQKQ